MSYQVFCTFDLKSASSDDYDAAYIDLARIGLKNVQKSDRGSDAVIPTTSAMGAFTGASAIAVRDYVRNEVEAAFRARRLRSEIFLVVGADWAWVATTS